MTITEIVTALLQGGYITKSGHAARHKAYKLMDQQVNPISYVSKSVVRRLIDRGAVKKHKKGYLVVTRRGIQQLRCNTLEKQTYRNERDSI